MNALLSTRAICFENSRPKTISKKLKKWWKWKFYLLFQNYVGVDNCMIYMFITVEKKLFLTQIFFFRGSVFYFSGETNKYFILHQKNILGYCMLLYDQYKELCFVEHLLKYVRIRAKNIT